VKGERGKGERWERGVFDSDHEKERGRERRKVRREGG
jgi:hypothetical protein